MFFFGSSFFFLRINQLIKRQVKNNSPKPLGTAIASQVIIGALSTSITPKIKKVKKVISIVKKYS